MVLGLRGPCSATSGGGVLIVTGEFCPSLREIHCECSGVTMYSVSTRMTPCFLPKI